MTDNTEGLLSFENAMEQVTRDLAHYYADCFGLETVRRCVEESYDLLASTARVRAHLVPLTSNFARDRLASLAKAEGLTTSEVPQVLFVCVQNAGRSQMAAALLADKVGDRVDVRSAGSAPAADVHPTVHRAMEEVGIDLSTAYPKPLTDETVRAADVVVTMGCGDACPVYPGKRYLNWELSDPAATDLDGVRLLRAEIDAHVTDLLQSLDIDIERPTHA
ncbi:arsenate reductase ArsC [Nocardioides pakistanensis]